MSEIQTLADRVSTLLAVGDLDGAGKLVDSVRDRPAQYEIGYTALALHKHDAPTALLHAQRAVAEGAGATGFQYLSLAQLLAGDAGAAIESARKAVALDRSPRQRASLASVFLATGRASDAIGVLKQVVVEAPSDHDALMNLATAHAQVGEYGEALTCYARAFEAAPSNTTTVQNTIQMLSTVGQWLGAVAAIEVLRTSSQVPPSVNLLLDVSMLHLVRIVGETFPAPHVASTADASVESAIASASTHGPAVQLAVVRMLLDLGRADEAKTQLERVAASVTTDADRATVQYLRGVLTRRAGDTTRALALYREALTLDSTRADAAVNATRLLLEQGTPEALAGIPEILAKVPIGSRSPELLVNEAAYLAATGQREGARALLERVLHITGGAGQVGKLALAALHELGR